MLVLTQVPSICPYTANALSECFGFFGWYLQGELGVVRLKAGEEGLSFPDCSVSEAFFGYTMEHIPLRIPSPDLWSYARWQRLLRQDKQLKGVGDGGGDAALVPWPQYDELRLQQEMAIRQLNHFVSICGGSASGGAEGDAEAREAQRKLQLLSKRHDKFCLRGFAKCTDDKRVRRPETKSTFTECMSVSF